MERFDLLHFIHKALRHALLTTNLESGRVDYADAGATKQIAEAWAQLCEHLGHHAHHEDQIIFPLLEARATGETEDLRHDHEVIHGLEAAMNGLLDGLAEESDVEVRRKLGRELHRSMQHYSAVCLFHFDDEERHLMPRLWALYEDVDLEAAFGQIMRTVSAEEREYTMAHMTQALDPSELDALRARMGAGDGGAIRR